MTIAKENLGENIVKFSEGPIEAIGFKIKDPHTRITGHPGYIFIFTRENAMKDNDELWMKLHGSQFHPSPYGICITDGFSYGPQSHNIPLDYDVSPKRQLRKIVNLLEVDSLITTEQRERAYKELGLGEDLYNRPTKKGHIP
jgi:hypothetical protein